MFRFKKTVFLMNWSIRPFHNSNPCIVYMEFSLKGGAIYGLWLRRRMLRRLGRLLRRIRRRIRLWRRIRACCGSIHSFNNHRRLLRLLNEQEGGFKAPLSFFVQMKKSRKQTVFCSFSIIPIMRPIPELARHLHSLAPVRITVSVPERMRHRCIAVADKRHSAVFLHAVHLHSLNCLLHIMQKSGDAELVLAPAKPGPSPACNVPTVPFYESS